ncbi:MAG: metal-dependent transcriptional regulator [Armatimonadota bacterium]|nr:metal-dependent transcriptional regulator [Armatimonadota bacterium]
MTVHDIARTERIEMYLKAIYTVAHNAPPVTVSKVAEYMGVAPPSAYEMLKRLEAQGLVQAMAGAGYGLSERGLATARKVVRRLRLAERLLTDVLRVDLPDVYAEACKLEHVISPVVEARLAEVLGHPATCPHGLPIPGEAAEEDGDLVTLDQIPVWGRAIVASIPEEDRTIVAHLAALGVLPGVVVQVREIGLLDGPITVEVRHQIRALGRALAQRVRVRPEVGHQPPAGPPRGHADPRSASGT